MGNHQEVADQMARLSEETYALAAAIGDLTYGPITDPHQAQVVAGHRDYMAASEVLHEAFRAHAKLCLEQGRAI